jgi:putative selenate reductase
MRPLPFEDLLAWILHEFTERQSIFGIHRSLFYVPPPAGRLAIPDVFGQTLATPIGPAAGPHTQLAQNILCSWLCGGRFIELKTVQIRDQLEISQELNLNESAEEYIKAWALLHILHRMLDGGSSHPGTIFNISVGYNLEGIQSAPMTRFLERMNDARAEISAIRTVLKDRFPQFAELEIPTRVANNVTLSTMHGCPSQEIEQIACYLMEERRLHTTVKLNPTLLGKKKVLSLLHDDLGFRGIQIPNAIFDHDLRYPRAIELIRSLKETAAKCGLTFGVKLSNTLPTLNHKKRLPGEEMYMSGRALYPLTMHLFQRLSADFEDDLNVSFSGGADAGNVASILAAGALTVTVATDVLKPGGYARFGQYLENLESELERKGIASLEEWRARRRSNLERAAADARTNRRYHEEYSSRALPKVESGLGFFDCIEAPCMAPCAVHQDVPEYAWFISRGEYDRALEVIMARNPLPGVTGYVCTQRCRSLCTRSAGNYDEPIEIRALKRFAEERGKVTIPAGNDTEYKVAIIGAGPSGLAAAYFLAMNGFRSTLFEARDAAGGMMRLASSFRLPDEIIRKDVDRIAGMGVDIRLGHAILRPPEALIEDGFDAVYIASGFQKDVPLYIEGIQGPGVIPALDFLRSARKGDPMELGPRVLIIGGGDTALDAARVAQRQTGRPVTVVYRRTREEMPAGEEDREGAFEEGVCLEELASPMRVIRKDGCVVALECLRNEPGEPGEDGRRRPIPIEGSEFRIPADSILVAIGQSPDLTFLHGSAVPLNGNGSIATSVHSCCTAIPWVFAGGDAVRGPASIIAACADGRRAAEAICEDFGLEFRSLPWTRSPLSEEERVRLMRDRARKADPHTPDRTSRTDRGTFRLIEDTLSEEEARAEARRCLQCSLVCDKCVEVCPNRANQAYQVAIGQWIMPILGCGDGKLQVAGETILHIKQPTQIVHLPDLCNECGNCATFCVHNGKPYRDKPRLFLRRSDFEKESERGFFFEKSPERWTLWRTENGMRSRLTMCFAAGEAVFENDFLQATFASADFSLISMELKQSFPGGLILLEPAEMFVLAQGFGALTILG